MNNESIKVKFDPQSYEDRYLRVKLDQNFSNLEVLSLKLTQQEIFSSFNADYGVLIGKVTANNNIGVPNAKISIFIPITDEDRTNPNILSIYPFESTRDKDQVGKKYNLLPRVSTGNVYIPEGSTSPVVPVGSFPTKEEILTNETFLEVYEKYYKYTTVTNSLGDYMIFGTPIGVYDVHMSVDVTDIGKFSMTPATMVSQLGYSENLFENNRVKKSNDLDTLPNVDLQTISVNIRPFWGDTENFEIGLTRQDFKLKAALTTSFTIFGAGFTDSDEGSWGKDAYYPDDRDISSSAMGKNFNEEYNGNQNGTVYNLGIGSKRNGTFNIEVYTIPNSISDSDIAIGNYDLVKDIVKLDKLQYNEIIGDGVFILTLPCNRTKQKYDEDTGQYVPTTDDDVNGVFTEFVGYLIIEYGLDGELPIVKGGSSNSRNRADRVKIKIPQYPTNTTTLPSLTYLPTNVPNGNTFSTERSAIVSDYSNPPTLSDDSTLVSPPTQAARISNNQKWVKQNFRFSEGKIYSVSKFNGTTYEDDGQDYYIYNKKDIDPFRNAGAISISATLTGNAAINEISALDNAQQLVPNISVTIYDLAGSSFTKIPSSGAFAAEWLNFCLYFPQVYNYTNGDLDVCRLFTNDFGGSTDMVISNNYLVGGTRRDTSYFMRSDLNPTSFVEVPREDIITIINSIGGKKGFVSDDFPSPNNLIGNYYGTSTKYFYRGIGNADCIQFLIDNGVISI